MEVARPAPGEAVDELAHERPHVGLELLDLAGHELRVEQAPVLRVLRRVDFERDLRLLAEVQVHVGGREVLRVAHRPEDVLVPVEEDLAPRLAVAPGDGALLAQPPVDGVRVVGGGRREQRARRIGGVGHAGTGRARLARSKPKTFAAFPETMAWRSSSDTPAN